jgi:hypothetical protein
MACSIFVVRRPCIYNNILYVNVAYSNVKLPSREIIIIYAGYIVKKPDGAYLLRPLVGDCGPPVGMNPGATPYRGKHNYGVVVSRRYDRNLVIVVPIEVPKTHMRSRIFIYDDRNPMVR